jgi:uncharacterized protein (DUF1330 family)
MPAIGVTPQRVLSCQPRGTGTRPRLPVGAVAALLHRSRRDVGLLDEPGWREAAGRALLLQSFNDPNITHGSSVSDPQRLAAYAKLAVAATAPFGARFLARGNPAVAYEHGLKERTVITEYPSLEKATASYGSPAYQEALKALGNGVPSQTAGSCVSPSSSQLQARSPQKSTKSSTAALTCCRPPPRA